jgi:hypothetical protein
MSESAADLVRAPGLKLNLGSGQNPRAGYVNVDKFGTPDVLWDLEQFPWPWENDSVEEVLLLHVLEHLGETSATFLGIFKELYRVCRADARIIIRVPHPRCDDFLNDPTHVRPITPDVCSLFSKRLNRQWQGQRGSNSPLGLFLDVDFEIVKVDCELTDTWGKKLREGMTQAQIAEAAKMHNNVVRQFTIELKAIK